MKKLILYSILLIISPSIFAANDFSCSKMDNKNFFNYSAIYGTFYTIGYYDSRNKKIDDEFDAIMKKIATYIKLGCEKSPNLNIFTLFKKGIKSGYAISDFSKREFKQPKFDIILYKLNVKADINTRECLKINLSEDLVQLLKLKFDELEKVCGKNCKRYTRKDLRKIFKKSEVIKFDKEFKLAYKKCKL